MAVLSSIQLSDVAKLQLLQQQDKYRQWRSLDEKRYCLVCGRVITGRDIQVVGGTRKTDPVRAVCPTKGCRSIPMDWMLPTTEILQATEESGRRQSQRLTEVEMKAPEQQILARVGKWTTRFKDDGN